VVGEIVPGSTADRMHVLKPGDRILKVDEDGKAMWILPVSRWRRCEDDLRPAGVSGGLTLVRPPTARCTS